MYILYCVLHCVPYCRQCKAGGGIAVANITMRVSENVRLSLGTLAAEMGVSMKSVLEDAVEAYRRQCFLQEANEAYAALRGDPVAWKAEAEEREEWDNTLSDGLEGD